jgi:hypothetical protein
MAIHPRYIPSHVTIWHAGSFQTGSHLKQADSNKLLLPSPVVLASAHIFLGSPRVLFIDELTDHLPTKAQTEWRSISVELRKTRRDETSSSGPIRSDPPGHPRRLVTKFRPHLSYPIQHSGRTERRTTKSRPASQHQWNLLLQCTARSRSLDFHPLGLSKKKNATIAIISNLGRHAWSIKCRRKKLIT